MVDIRNVTLKPTVVCSFRAATDCPGDILVRVEVDARGKMLVSSTTLWDAGAWSPEVYSDLSTLSEAYSSASDLADEFREASPPNPTAQMLRTMYTQEEEKHIRAANIEFWAKFNPVRAQRTRLADELKSLSKQMAARPFMRSLAERAIVLHVRSDDNDERSYALYRGSVWSCIRALEPEQWQILVDRVIKREEAELSSALAEESDTSQGRERLSREVRDAVWTRDQGKCARCGSRERLEFDHIVPVARGGSNTERNIELLCEICNRAKSDSIM